MSSDKGEGTASQYPSSLSEEGLSDSWALRDVWKAGRGKQCWLRSGHVLHDGCVCVRARPRSVLSDSATPWTVACQAPLSVRFSRQEYWSGFPFTPPGDLPDAGIKPVSPVSPALAAGLFITVLPGEHLQASSHPGAAQHHGADYGVPGRCRKTCPISRLSNCLITCCDTLYCCFCDTIGSQTKKYTQL